MAKSYKDLERGTQHSELPANFTAVGSVGPTVQFREEPVQFGELPGVANVHGSVHPKLAPVARQKIIDIASEHHKDGKIGSSQGKDFMVTNNRLPAFHQAMTKAGFAHGPTGHYLIH